MSPRFYQVEHLPEPAKSRALGVVRMRSLTLHAQQYRPPSAPSLGRLWCGCPSTDAIETEKGSGVWICRWCK